VDVVHHAFVARAHQALHDVSTHAAKSNQSDLQG
jgi:hypothetical protein